ncbi:activity-regulated cytoskeleton associated protein 2-like [Musca vetustissima]|uniref:activity-regulated cytoskeleton associated protein 2-like n=1 Tax=Musca vetustissima TaxID=27455 RepID=UPI002AB732A7|nr:activity-regulated cytoskeleton associated protein 2-like [Musca vetustissima]
MATATLTAEMLEKLMRTVAEANIKVSSFANCSARYSGEGDATKVEEFISAITTFKMVENVSDENAINGMPMLLLGDASEWWAGVKGKAKKFDDVVKMLRDSFCPPKPAWRIYAEIMEGKQQRGEATDSFIRKKRALFAKLTKSPSENDQIDIIFGMLSIDIRDRVFRHKVSSFDDLLKDAREAENVIAERQNNDGVKPKTSGSVRCAFCHRKGHKVEDCFKKKHVEDEGRRNAISTARENTSKPKIACYGCNAPGVVRANCPNCKSKKDGTNDQNVAYFNRICSDLVQSI